MKRVMMIPLRRCGSNAIRLRMNLHPGFHSPYPLHLCDVPLSGNVDLADDAAYRRLTGLVVGLQQNSLVPWGGVSFDVDPVFEAVRGKPRSIFQIYWHLLLESGAANGASVVMDKCQDSVRHYKELTDLFPDMMFVDVVRDPRAQVSSMNDAIIYDFDTQLNTMRWVEARQWADRLRADYPGRVLTIRYEDFVADQESVLRSVCGFVGLPFDPVVLDVSASEEARRMSRISPLWETNDSPPIPSYAHKFTKRLSLLEVENIEAATRPWMRQFGYPTMTACEMTFSRPLPEARRASGEKKDLAWQKLRKTHPEDYALRARRQNFLKKQKFH